MFVVVVSVFVTEFTLMLGLALLPPLAIWAEALLDATALLLLLVPTFYFSVYRPRSRLLAELERDAEALRAAHARLESDVVARTAQLSETNTRLEESVQRLAASHREITLLGEMVDLFQSCRTVEEAHEVIARCAAQLFPGESGEIFVFKASRNTIESVAAWGAPFHHERSIEPGECWALRRGRAHLVEAAPLSVVCRHAGPPMPTASLCVPMMAQGEAIGMMTLRRDGENGAPGSLDDLRPLATTTAEHIALALSNINLRETLRHQAVRDVLTGLFNRRYLEETLEREVRRAERRKLPLAVIMLDVDHFKRFNDTHGHDGGDALLRAVGEFLRTHVRPEDIACRYGGEEFTLILPDASWESTLRRADELREGIAHLGVEHLGRKLGDVTVSMGVAVFPEHGTTPGALLRLADRALYRAKQEGRNRVVLAEPPGPPALPSEVTPLQEEAKEGSETREPPR